jgi:hypothetical protein
MERFAMNLKRTVLAAATALLTAATVTAASAQTQERSSTRMNKNLSTGGQMNAQAPGTNAGTQFQGGVNRSEGKNVGRSQFQGTSRSAMTSNRYNGTYGGDRDRFAYGRDRDRDRFASYGRDRDRFAYSGRLRDRDRFGSGGWNSGWGGPTFDVSVGYGGWGWPGYYDSGYGYASPGLYSYAPGYVGVGFGGGCTCGASGSWR